MLLVLVLAGAYRPALLAQSSATITVSATVLPGPRLGMMVASLDPPGSANALSLAMGTTLLSASRGDAASPLRRAIRATDAGPQGTAGAVPDAVLQQRGPATVAAPNARGRPESPPTVRITLAYTAN